MLYLVFGILNGFLEMQQINQMYAILIPKVKSPKLISHLRLVSFCSVVYKIVSKMLANRMKDVLPVLLMRLRVLSLKIG